MSRWIGIAVMVVACSATGCRKTGTSTSGEPGPGPCALIVTDDDIPSGSATAGALYVGEDALGRRLLTADVQAADLYRYAYDRLDEVMDGPMKEWCLEGMAETAEATGDADLAQEARRRLERIDGS